MQDDRALGYYLRIALNRIQNKAYVEEIEARRVYDGLVGEVISRLTQSFSLHRGVLYLRVATPAIKHEIMMRRSNLCRAINVGVGYEVVNKIVIA